MYLGSDALAVGPFTKKITYLEEGDYVAVDRNGARMFDVDGAAGRAADRPGLGLLGPGREGRVPALHGKGDP